MTPPGTTLRNLRAASECTWAATFEKCKTKELRCPHQRTTLLGNLGSAPQWCPARTAGIRPLPGGTDWINIPLQWCPAEGAGIRWPAPAGTPEPQRLNGVRPERPESGRPWVACRSGWRGPSDRTVRTALRLLNVEPMTGIEPAYSAWEADVLPLNYIGVRR